MLFIFDIPTPTGNHNFTLKSGNTIIFVGANGGGKTRLATQIEERLALNAHRISAHRALNLNPEVAKISEQQAYSALRTGSTEKSALEHYASYRLHSRWGNDQSVSMLNDFDYLIQTLFADQNNTALETHNKNRAGDMSPATPTKFERLKEVWERLLPHRKLHITGDSINVLVNRTTYTAKQMSDGERAIFYLLGQALCAAHDSVLIVDEPELHIYRGIMAPLWDEIEALRPDCAIILISHDLEFAASRAAKKYIIRDFAMPAIWTIEEVPDVAGFSEEIATQILGSRRPILFVEGTGTSLDHAIYRACYPNLMIIPCSSCEHVIHSVTSMRANAMLTRITCTGVVDKDGRTQDEIDRLARHGIVVLPVSEVENLFLLPDIARAIGMHEGHDAAVLDAKMNEIIDGVIANIHQGNNLEDAVLRYCRRRIDRILKVLDFSGAASTAEIAASYSEMTAALNIEDIANEFRQLIQRAVNNRDLPALLALYDNKGLFTIVGIRMRSIGGREFENWLMRMLNGGKIEEVTKALSNSLPNIQPR